MLAVSSEEVSELLAKLVNTVEILMNKVDILTGQVVDLQSRMDDLVDDFQLEEIDSLEELISDMEEWQASCVELKDLEGVNSEALWRAMQWRLDEDMAQLRAKGLAEPKKMNVDDLYEVTNCEFWYGLGGPEKMAEMKLKWDLFQATRNEFYKLNGRQSEWQFWKDYLRKHKCDNFMVEDSDLGEKVLNGKVRKSWKPYGKDLGIPVLDGLFVLDGDTRGRPQVRGMEMKRVERVRKSQSLWRMTGVHRRGVLRMLRWEKSQVLWGPWMPSSFLWSLFFLDKFFYA